MRMIRMGMRMRIRTAQAENKLLASFFRSKGILVKIDTMFEAEDVKMQIFSPPHRSLHVSTNG